MLLIGIYSFINWHPRHKRLPAGRENSLQDHEQINLREAFSAAGIGSAIILVSGGLIWIHYYILLIPLALFMIRPFQKSDQQSLLQQFMRAASIIALLHFTPIFLFSPTLLYQCLMFNIATLMLIAFAFNDIWHQGIRQYS
jgi:hypothetical protein